MFKGIAEAINAELAEQFPDLQLSLTGKRETSNGIIAVILGDYPTPTIDDYKDIQERVDNLMQSLKNPANLVTLLRKHEVI